MSTDTQAAPKAWRGRFFEDFAVGDVFRSRLGRTITETDNIWFTCLTLNTNQIHFNVPYAERTQFGKPLVSFQIVQERLAKMLADVTGMQLYCLQLGRLIEQQRLRDTIAGLAKMNNTIKARQVIAEARNLLGGNGILLDYHVRRHMADIEAIYTFEGTETIQALIVGRDITGVSAFN